MHESSPSNRIVAGGCKYYSFSYYMPELERGALLSGGGTCEDIENLTLPDKSVDIFITQDVLEHVFSPERAIKEILRVFKPGGWHIFTTPRDPHRPASVQRARLENGQVRELLPAEYHGNPVGDSKALVTFDWGRDFESKLYAWSGVEALVLDRVDKIMGIEGVAFEVFALRRYI